MSIPVPTSAFLDDLLTKAIAVGGSLETSTLHLYQNDFTPNKNSVLADFTEADYDIRECRRDVDGRAECW